MQMIYNIEPGTFGGPMRMGDLLGVCNVVAYLRKVKDDNSIRFFLQPGSISSEEHVQFFHSFLIAITDYFSAFSGTESLAWRRVNVWDFRDISGDLLTIHNFKDKKKKIVIWPVFDATYNQYRNWPDAVYHQILNSFNSIEFDGYEKVLCVSPDTMITATGWQISTDYETNLNHIKECEIFVGGDTGTSHLAGSLDRGPKELIYYYSSRGLVHTLPFHLRNGKGKLITYWRDLEGTTWG